MEPKRNTETLQFNWEGKTYLIEHTGEIEVEGREDGRLDIRGRSDKAHVWRIGEVAWADNPQMVSTVDVVDAVNRRYNALLFGQMSPYWHGLSPVVPLDPFETPWGIKR